MAFYTTYQDYLEKSHGDFTAHIPTYDLTSRQQAHVDVKITQALLKKGHSDLWARWSQEDRAWLTYRLHEAHDHGGFAITPNYLTRISAFYTSTGRFVTWGGQLSTEAQRNFFPTTTLLTLTHGMHLTLPV